MAKKITPDQVIEKNLWQNTIESTKLLIEVVDKLDVSLKKVATDSKAALKGNSTQDFAGLKGADEEVKKVNKAFEDKIKLDKQRIALTKTMMEVIKQNFKNLVLTNPGERVMLTDFGVGIRRFLFEMNLINDQN